MGIIVAIPLAETTGTVGIVAAVGISHAGFICGAARRSRVFADIPMCRKTDGGTDVVTTNEASTAVKIGVTVALAYETGTV